jgi:membrane protein YqaA with SNARE-associated domain
VASGRSRRELVVTDGQIAAWSAEPAVIALLLLWGIGEAIALPIVPDVLLGLMALASPAALGAPLAAAIIGGVLGAIALRALLRVRPSLVRRILDVQPGIGTQGMAEARRRIEAGAIQAFAQIGPGLPLKAYVATLLQIDPASGHARVATLALVNRISRLLPVVAAFALVGLAGRAAGLSPAALVPAYAVGWTAFYLVFWWIRRG